MKIKSKIIIIIIVIVVILVAAVVIYWESTHGNRGLIDTKYRFDRAIIAPGHFNVEEPGMNYMEVWLPEQLKEDIPVHYVQAGDMYCFL